MKRSVRERLRMRKRSFVPNTFIGGIGDTINTPELMATKISTDIKHIKNFKVDSNNNISFYVGVDYNFINPGFDGMPITYYIDLDSKAKYSETSQVIFRTYSMKAVLLNGLTGVRSSMFRYASIPFLNLENIEISSNSYLFATADTAHSLRLPELTNVSLSFASGSNITRCYIPKVTSWYNDNNVNTPFINISLGCKIYVKPSELTAYGGQPPFALTYARDTRGAILISVDDFTPPSQVIDLSADLITTSGCRLNFSAPSSINLLSFYEVWVERQDLGEWETERVIQRYNYYKEVELSGDTIEGLISGVSYRVKIIACDVYWNRSEFSNEITVTTL